MARLNKLNNSGDMSQPFSALGISCSSKVRYSEIKQYITKLEYTILFTVNHNENISEIKYLQELEEEMPNEQGDSLTYKDKSFWQRSYNIYKKCSNLHKI